GQHAPGFHGDLHVPQALGGERPAPLASLGRARPPSPRAQGAAPPPPPRAPGRACVTDLSSVRLRAAVAGDVEELTALIRTSVLGLGAGDYSSEQLASALEHLFGVDTRLIADG